MGAPRRVVLLALASYLVACGGDNGTGPVTPVPTTITKPAGDNQTVEVATAVPVLPAVQIKDQNGNPMTGVDVTFTLVSGGGSITGNAAVTGANGVATVGSWVLGTAAGLNTLRASVANLAAVTFTATGTAGPATALALTTAPSATVSSGADFPQQPVIQLRDAFGNNRPQAGVAVTVALQSGGGTLNGTTTLNTDATGAASFTNLAIIGTVGPRTLAFTSAGLTSILSGNIDVQVGAPTGITAITSTILGGTVGQLVSNRPTVQVTDASGNPVVGATVTFTVTSGGGSVTGGTVTAGLGGIAQVGGWTLGTVAGDNTLDATVAALPAVTFTATADPGPAANLVIATQPAASASGSVLSPAPAVQLQDTFGNTVAQSGVVVTASIASGGGTLTGSVTAATNGTGKASFGSLTLTGTSGNHTLGFASTGLTAATSGAFNINAGPATTIAASSATSQSATAGTAVATKPAVLVTDASGNPVTGAAVTFSVTSGGGSLTGAAQTTNASGIATVGSWTLGGLAGANTLTASAGGLAGSPVIFSATGQAAAASRLAMVTQPSASALNGAVLAQQPVVRLLDPAGNPVSQSGVSVTATIGSGGGTLGGTTSVNTNAGGVATFTNLSITGLVGARTLSFASAGLTSTTSSSVTITTGAAALLAAASTTNQSQTVGLAVAAPPAVIATDQSGNPVAGVAVSFAVTSGGGNVTGASQTTNASGIATVGSWTVGAAAGSNTVTGSSAGLGGSPVTFTATGVAANATQLSLTTGPSATAQSGVSFVQQPVLQLRDAGGNPVGVSGTVVTATIASGGGTLGGTTTAITNTSGVATFSGLGISGTVGNRTLQFASAGLSSVNSGNIALTAGPAANLAKNGGDNQTASVSTAVLTDPSVQVTDASGNPVSGTVVIFAPATGGGAVTGANPVTNAVGIATLGSWTLGASPGANTLTAAVAGAAGSPATFTATGVAAGSDRLLITTQPSATAASGTGFAVQPAIQLADGAGTPIATAGVVVTAAKASGSGTLGGTTTATTDAAGLATFTNLSITGPVGNKTLLFSAPAFTSINSSLIALTAGAATTMVLSTGDNQTAPAGTAVPVRPAVVVRDASGNPVAGVNVTFAVQSGGGAITGPAQVTNATGIGRVGSWTLGALAGSNTLTATSAGLTGSPVTFTATATAGSATDLTITTQPSASAQSGVSFAQQPVIQLRDAGGNPVSQAGVGVTAVLATGAGTLGGTTTVNTNASGAASFTDLVISGAVGSRTIQFSSAGLTSVTSGTVAVSAGPAATLALNAGDAQSATVGAAVAIAPSVLVSDASGNPVSGVSVSFAIGSGGGGLTGASAISNASGLATLGSWTLGLTAGAQTLTATSGGLAGSPVSFTATATPDVATNLAITTQPSASAQNGVVFAQQPVVRLRDANGNNVSQSGVVVTASVASGAGVLGGTLTRTTSASGVATFTNLQITGALGNRTLQFSASGVSAATSTTVAVASGAAATLAKNGGDNQTATVATAVPAAPSVLVTDASGNPVSGVSVTFAVATGGGSITGATPVTDVSGIAAVGSWTLGAAAGSNTLTATAAGLTGSPATFTATGAAANASRLVVTTAPSATAQNGAVLAQEPVIQLQDALGNDVAQAGVVVTAAIGSGGGTLGGTATATTSASGAATFTNLSLSGTVGSRTLLFSAPTYTSATSGTIALSAGTAANVASSAGDGQTATAGAAVATPPAVMVTDPSGNPVSGVGVTFAVTSGGGSITGGAATSDANGIAAVGSWTLGTVAGANTLTATAAGLTGSPVTFTATGAPGAATALVITTEPAGAVNGLALGTQPALALRDAFNNPVLQAGVAVTATIASGGGTLGGAVSVATNASGVASFTDLSLVGTAGSRTLSFAATGITGATSASFNLSAGAATALAMVTQPSTSAVNGSALGQQPAVRVVDAGGNSVSQAGVVVTVSRSPTTAGLGGTLSATTSAAGVATFTNLSLTGSVGSYTVAFAATGLTSVTSTTISLTAGPAASITALSPSSQSAGVGTDVANPPSVQVTDLGGNPVPGVAVTFSVTAGGGTTTPAGPLTTDGTGTATLTSWKLGPSAGLNTVNASAALVGATINFDATGTYHVASVTSGGGHSCSLTVDGIAYCWGENTNGGLGDNSRTDRLTPVAVAGNRTFTQLSAGRLYSCGIGPSGTAFCWGRNTDGALGNGSTAQDSVPHTVSGGHVFQSIVTGAGSTRQTCGITTALAAFCWGADGNGQVGNGPPLTNTTTPAAVLGGGSYNGLGAKSFYTCGVRTTGAAFCWGDDAFGQLGNGAPKSNTNQPSAVSGGLTFSQVSPGQVSACGLVSGGAAYCWGANFNGRLGVDTLTTSESLVPLAVSGGLTFASLVSGDSFSCALTAGGQAYCWGLNDSGQLGNGSPDNAITPTLISGGLSFTSLAAGSAHVCGVTSSQSVYCWGDNSTGQLGDGTTTDRDVPTLVTQP